MRTSHKKINKLKKIKILILDVDGVLTDGRIIYSDTGEEMKIFDAHDGHGIVLLRDAGVKVIFLSGRRSHAVERRAKELGIFRIYLGVRDKNAVYDIILRKFGIEDEEVCYIGDDIPDTQVMKRAGVAVAPQDAVDEAKNVALIVTKNGGGRGAVREVCDLILRARA